MRVTKTTTAFIVMAGLAMGAGTAFAGGHGGHGGHGGGHVGHGGAHFSGGSHGATHFSGGNGARFSSGSVRSFNSGASFAQPHAVVSSHRFAGHSGDRGHHRRHHGHGVYGYYPGYDDGPYYDSYGYNDDDDEVVCYYSRRLGHRVCRAA